MPASTNALTKRYCATQGWPCETVQSWRGKVRHDLFGIADSIVLRPDGEVWAQNASYGSLKAHRARIDASDVLPHLGRLGRRVELWEWRRKRVGRRKLWFLRVQGRSSSGWGEIGAWEGPLDL